MLRLKTNQETIKVRSISEIISVPSISVIWQKRDTAGRSPERPAEECSSFCGPAHTPGPESDGGSLKSTEPDPEPSRRREDRQREVEYEVRAGSHRFTDRKSR